MSFNIGDKVRVKAGIDVCTFGHAIVTVVGLIDGERLEVVNEGGKSCEHSSYCYELVEKAELKKGIFMSLKDKVRELALSKEVKLRRKHGVIDGTNNRTVEGTDILLDILFEANLAEIDKKLLKIEAEEKAAKK